MSLFKKMENEFFLLSFFIFSHSFSFFLLWDVVTPSWSTVAITGFWCLPRRLKATPVAHMPLCSRECGTPVYSTQNHTNFLLLDTSFPLTPYLTLSNLCPGYIEPPPLRRSRLPSCPRGTYRTLSIVISVLSMPFLCF